jgi:YVTN family beta-propeller protein
MKKHVPGVVAFFALLATLLVPASHACSYSFPNDEPVDTIYDKNNGRVFVSLFSANQVLQFGHNCVLERTFGTGSNPGGLSFDGTNLWVALYGSNAVEKINVTTGSEALYSVGVQPRGVAFDGTYIWVTNSGSNTVTKILASNGFVQGAINVGSYPYGVAVNSTNAQTTVWVANRDSASISIINAQTNVLIATIGTGSEPQFFATNPYADNGIIGLDMWVSCYSSQLVEQFTYQGSLVASYAITGHGQPLGLSLTSAGVAGATHSGNVFSITPNGVSYTPVGSNNYGAVFDVNWNTLWVTDLNQGTIFEIPF